MIKAEMQWIIPILCIFVIGLVLNHLRLRKRYRDEVARIVLRQYKILPHDFDLTCRQQYWIGSTHHECACIVKQQIEIVKRQNEQARFRERKRERSTD